MNYYKNDKDTFDYDNVIEYLDEVDRKGVIGGQTFVDAYGNPFFTRHDYPIPSVITTIPSTNYYCIRGSHPICDFSNNIYFPISTITNIGILKMNTNNLTESVILQHTTLPSTFGNGSPVAGSDKHCIVPSGLIVGSTKNTTGVISQLLDINTSLVDTSKFKSTSITATTSGKLSETWGNPVYNKKHNCVYFTPTDNNMEATDSWCRLNLNNNPYTLESYSFGYEAGEYWDGKYRNGVHTKNNRIFLIPYLMNSSSTSTKLHYIDCSGVSPVVQSYSSGTFVSELHSLSTSGIYNGGVYVPSLDRIYFIPSFQCLETVGKKLHYIQNCSTTPSIASYTHNLTTNWSDTSLQNRYINGLYIGNGLIFMIPIEQCTLSTFHLIDTKNNTIIEYNSFLSSTALPVVERVSGWIAGATLVGDKIFFSYNAGTKITGQTSWFYLNLNHNMPYSVQYTSHPLKLNS